MQHERSGRLGFGLLGSLLATREGVPVTVGGLRQRIVLALLLLHANEVVPRERLIDGLWGETPPETAANALQVAVHALRKLFGHDRVERHGGGYRLRLEEGELDVHRFEQLVERARAAGDSRAEARLLREALALWRGPALADLRDAPFAEREASRLEELRLTTLERRIAADLDCGEDLGLTGELESLIADEPYRERLHGQLMLALYRAGRQAEALEAYGRARRLLVDELGMEPGPALQELERRILRQDASLLETASGPRLTRRGRRTCLQPRRA